MSAVSAGVLQQMGLRLAIEALLALSVAGCSNSNSSPTPAVGSSDVPPVTGPAPTISVGGQSGEGDIPLVDSCSGLPLNADIDTGQLAHCQRDLERPGFYRCCCDPTQCAAAVAAADDCDALDTATDARVTMNEADADSGASHCLVPATSCAEALHARCAVESVLGPRCLSNAGGVTAFCVAGAEGGYSCYCPDRDVHGAEEAGDCVTAMRGACAEDCDSSSGHCSFQADGSYHCTCNNGLGGTAFPTLCERALSSICEPACENELGACHGDPFGYSFACQCAGEPAWHLTPERVAGTVVHNCLGQISDFCAP